MSIVFVLISFIVVIAALVVVLITLHFSGWVPISVLRDNNIGNQFAGYGLAMYQCFSRGRDFQWNLFHFGKPSLITKVDRYIPYKGSGYKSSLWSKKIIQFGNNAGCWGSPSFWNAIRIPLSFQIEKHFPPLSKSDEEDARKSGVLHFRMSDSPFNRHYCYSFMKYRWWKNVIRKHCSINIKDIYVLWSYQHQINTHKVPKTTVTRYFDDFMKTMREEFPNIQFHHRGDSSPESDIQFMRKAKILVSPISSFSWLAAITGEQECAVIVEYLERGDKKLDPSTNWPSHVIEYPRESACLEHRDVIDYRDIDTVLKQLS